jgi:hypothetical protein
VGITATKTDPPLEDSRLIGLPNSASLSLIPAGPMPGAAPSRNFSDDFLWNTLSIIRNSHDHVPLGADGSDL